MRDSLVNEQARVLANVRSAERAPREAAAEQLRAAVDRFLSHEHVTYYGIETFTDQVLEIAETLSPAGQHSLRVCRDDRGCGETPCVCRDAS